MARSSGFGCGFRASAMPEGGEVADWTAGGDQLWSWQLSAESAKRKGDGEGISKIEVLRHGETWLLRGEAGCFRRCTFWKCANQETALQFTSYHYGGKN
jgi:hypothetical protein